MEMKRFDPIDYKMFEGTLSDFVDNLIDQGYVVYTEEMDRPFDVIQVIDPTGTPGRLEFWAFEDDKQVFYKI
ncbi:hypothetical protein [Oceanotoga phage vB_OteS-UFV02]